MATDDYPTRIGLEDALAVIATRAAGHRLPPETVMLADAQNRVLSKDVFVPVDLPPFANSAMDGFALRARDLPQEGEHAFALVGDVFAGASFTPEVGTGQCVRVTTGAPMPAGADTVVIKENVRVEGDRIVVKAGEKAGGNVRAAGEDFAIGDRALAAGTTLHAPQLAVLAALGVGDVPVCRRPRAAVVVTGDELVPAGQPLGFGQIHESNCTMLTALLRDAGAEVIEQTVVRDEPAALREALIDAAAQVDVIVSSGGVSVGEADYMPALLAELGEVHFHKVRLKPGMPTLFGQIGASLYFGLPGNPVSAAVTFRVFVRFALNAMLGTNIQPLIRRARLAKPVHKRHARAELLRCVVRSDETGVWWATPHAKQGSGMLRGLAESDALALLPEGGHEFAEGDVVVLWPE